MTAINFNLPVSLNFSKDKDTFHSLSEAASLMSRRAQELRQSDNVKSFTINLERSDNGSFFYSPGETINGEIRIHAARATNLTMLSVKVMGVCTVSTPEGKSSKRSKSSRIHHSYLDEHLNLVKNEGGAISKEGHIPAGTAKMAFQYSLPMDIPSSFHGEYGSVVYHISGELLEEGVQTPLTTGRPFVVARHLTKVLPIARPLTATSVFHRACFPGRVYARCKINRKHYEPGDSMECSAKVWNNSNKLLHALEAAIHMHVTYENPPKKKKFKHTQVVARKTDRYELGQNEGRNWDTVNLSVPAHLPETGLTACIYINVAYEFVFSMTSESIKNPLQVRIPILIGRQISHPVILTEEGFANEKDGISDWDVGPDGYPQNSDDYGNYLGHGEQTGSMHLIGQGTRKMNMSAIYEDDDGKAAWKFIADQTDDGEREGEDEEDKHAAIKEYVLEQGLKGQSEGHLNQRISDVKQHQIAEAVRTFRSHDMGKQKLSKLKDHWKTPNSPSERSSGDKEEHSYTGTVNALSGRKYISTGTLNTALSMRGMNETQDNDDTRHIPSNDPYLHASVMDHYDDMRDPEKHKASPILSFNSIDINDSHTPENYDTMSMNKDMSSPDNHDTMSTNEEIASPDLSDENKDLSGSENISVNENEQFYTIDEENEISSSPTVENGAKIYDFLEKW